MKHLLFVLSFMLCNFGLAQNQADEFYDPEDMQQSRDNIKKMAGGQTNYLVFAEQFEYRDYEQKESLALDAQAWVGGDINKFWTKIEGDYSFDSDQAQELELQALYSKAISPFWNFQLGARHDFKPQPSQAYGVIGLQGLASYWFEIDAALFVSKRGKISARVEAQYDMHVTQRLILQPRIELNAAFSKGKNINSGEGINAAEIGFRLRYDFKREVAPYIGLSWKRAYGETANLVDLAGEDIEQFAIVAGIRFWY